MSAQHSNRRRRQVFGAALVTLGVLLLAVAMVARARFVIYAALACAAAGVWMIARRDRQ